MTEIRDVLALRNQIIQRNNALKSATALTPPDVSRPDAFASKLQEAMGDKTATQMVGGVQGSGEASSFGSIVKSIADTVNASQEREDVATEAFERGETTDIASVVLMGQRASIDFEATLQVRNKLLAAYKEIMNIQL
ncbi:MAG: flagellar hook-basal body complex protein FliE [Sphingomonadales bacterium]|nr:flagellar hook-basal body complex protein FliE [Sphingomonadales bacterium]